MSNFSQRWSKKIVFSHANCDFPGSWYDWQFYILIYWQSSYILDAFIYYVRRLWTLFKNFILAGSHSAVFIMWALVYFYRLGFQWQVNFQSLSCVILVWMVYLIPLQLPQVLVPKGVERVLQSRFPASLGRGRKSQALGNKCCPRPDCLSGAPFCQCHPATYTLCLLVVRCLRPNEEGQNHFLATYC